MSAVTPAREPVYAALFALLDSLRTTGPTPLLKTTSRRLKLIQEVDDTALPAGFQAQDDQLIKKAINLPGVMTWKAHWFLYAFEPNPDAAPSVQLNTLVDNAVALLNPPSGQETFTLGGLVHSCAVEGTIQIFEGVLGSKAVAIIPITLLVPGFRP